MDWMLLYIRRILVCQSNVPEINRPFPFTDKKFKFVQYMPVISVRADTRNTILHSQTEMTVFKFDSLASNWIYILAEFKFDGVAAQKSCDIIKSVKAMYAVTQLG